MDTEISTEMGTETETLRRVAEIILGEGALVCGFDPGNHDGDPALIAAARAAAAGPGRIGLTVPDGAGARFTVAEEPLPVRVAGQTAPLADLAGPAWVTAELSVELALGAEPPRTAANLCWIGERVDGGVTVIHLPRALRTAWTAQARPDREGTARVTYTACGALGEAEQGFYRIRAAAAAPAEEASDGQEP